MGHEAVEVLEREFVADQITQVLGWCIMGMTPELQKYYEARFAMFAMKAWKDLVEDVSRMIDATDKLEGVHDLRQLGFKQGEVSIMRWIVNMEEMTNIAYRELTNEDT